jgi:hypothetical protein
MLAVMHRLSFCVLLLSAFPASLLLLLLLLLFLASLLLLQSHLSTRRYGTVTHMPPEVSLLQSCGSCCIIAQQH